MGEGSRKTCRNNAPRNQSPKPETEEIPRHPKSFVNRKASIKIPFRPIDDRVSHNDFLPKNVDSQQFLSLQQKTQPSTDGSNIHVFAHVIAVRHWHNTTDSCNPSLRGILVNLYFGTSTATTRRCCDRSTCRHQSSRTEAYISISTMD